MKRPDAHDTEVAIRRRSSLDVNLGDRTFRLVTAAFAAGAVVILASIVVQLFQGAWPSIARFGAGFLTSSDWDPVHDKYGAVPFLYGTVMSSLVALMITVPIAFGVAIFLSELAPPWIRGPLGFMVELLAAIPSVVYGLWGIFVLAPFMRSDVDPILRTLFGWTGFFSGPTNGHDMLTGAVILSIMILPTIASISRDVLRAAPPTLREGALALGATRWEAVRTAVLPYVRSGLVGAVLLGLGRALGETMAITMVIGNSDRAHQSLFQGAQTMASKIANEYAEASNDLHLAALTEIGLLLLAVTLLFNLAARILVWKMRGPVGQRPV
ncbi:MAG TPA: phosphate ABC transporter permease subunit PstC [Kofleriaceae bacterium]|nr:phosphate ABC transporter permease subunit PstC [Kofleriaceae bacterium]